MKILFKLFTILALLIFSYSSPINLLPSKLKKEAENITRQYMEYIQSNMIYSLKNITTLLSPNCLNSLKELTANAENNDYLTKFIRDSARSKDDLGSHQECLSIDYNKTIYDTEQNHTFLKNLTYLVIQIKSDKKDIKNYTLRSDYDIGYFLGICIKSGCSEKEYTRFFLAMNENFGNLLGQLKEEQITTINIKDINEKFYDGSYFVSLIPFFILLLIISFTIFPSLVSCFFKCCFVKKKKKKVVYETILDNTELNPEGHESNKHKKIANLILSETEENNRTKYTYDDEYNRENLDRFEKCFSFQENRDFALELKTPVLNDSGLHFVKGVRVISLILFLVSLVYYVLINSPIKIYCQVRHKKLLTSPFFSFIFIGSRVSPRILFALSGFVLSYKLYNYLEEKVDKEQYTNNTNTQERINRPQSATLVTNQRLTENVNLTRFYSIQKKNINKIVTFSLFFKFVFPHFHKYFLFVLGFLLLKYSLYYVVGMFSLPGPMWVFLNYFILGACDIYEVIEKLTLVDIFFFTNNTIDSNGSVYWIIKNECLFFIFGSILIFLFYKKQWRIDIFLVFSCFGLFFAKIGVFFLARIDNFYPSLITSTQKYGYLFEKAYFNLIYFLIGVYFGLVNYVIQKSITEEDIEINCKYYFSWPLAFVRFFRGKSTFKFIFIFFISFLYFAFDIFSYLIFEKQMIGDNFEYLSNIYLEIFYLVDVDIFVFLFFVSFLALFLMGNNFFIDFLSHNGWLLISRSYVSFVLSSYIVVLYVLLQSESRLNLEIFNVLFFSFFTIFVQIIVSSLVFLTLELPLKRVNKFLVRDQSDNEKSLI